MNKSEQLIACLEGEIAKRDEELSACRVAVENCEMFRDRIAELTAELEESRKCAEIMQQGAFAYQAELAAIKAREPAFMWHKGATEDESEVVDVDCACPCCVPLYAAPVSEAKAQGVVMPPSPYMPGSQPTDFTDYELGEIHGRIAMWEEVKRLNGAPVQQPKCKTCNDNGRIGGPSFYAPDEGGEPCPDCSAPIQQVSVPDGFERYRLADKFCEQRLVTDDHVRAIVVDAFASGYGFGIAAAPSAPAADAWLHSAEWTKDADEWGDALNYAAWEFTNECPEKSALLFNNTKGPLRAAIMKYAELVSANRPTGVE